MKRSGKPRPAHKRDRGTSASVGGAPPATFTVRGDHITLGQLLKVVGAIGAGGEARGYLDSGAVEVNGQPEARRGRKLRAGDHVRIGGAGEWRLVGDGEPADHPAGGGPADRPGHA